MDRAKFTKLCERVIKKSAGKPPSDVAVEIADALELILEMECPDLDTQDKPIDLQQIVAVSKPEPGSTALPPSPSVVSSAAPSRKLIVTPEEASAKPIPPVRMHRAPVDEPGEDQDTEYWTVPSLVQELYDKTPETIEVRPYGTEVDIVLARDILADHVLKAAKLVYTMSGQKKTQPWVISPGQGARASSELDPPSMSIDLPVFRDFFTTDKNLDLPDKIESITEDARKVYAPRPKEIHSSTPRRSGPIRFDPSCPHADADVLVDQQGRSY